MAVTNTCCLPGFTYNSGSHLCVQNINNSITTPPVPCACCPVGYVYIDSSGYINDPILGHIPISNPNPVPFYDTCARIVNVSYALTPPSPIDPIACPCCPPGYTYSSNSGFCIDDINIKRYIDPIPCIPCVCEPPSSIAVAVDCGTCGTAGEQVSFMWNFTQRACELCDPIDFNPPKGKVICFMPNQFSDPNTTFTLKNLNFI